MKKYYKFGEIILALREEYRDCKHILYQLGNCINIEDENVKFYFSGLLSDTNSKDLNDRKIRLIVEKKYLDILKKIQYMKYDWYSQFLYKSFLTVEKQSNGLYGFNHENILSPVDEKKYIPKVEIIDQNQFSNLIDELLSSDLMQLKRGYFNNNYDSISLRFDDAHISTSLGNGSSITWNGNQDSFEYSISRHCSPALIEKIFSLEMPADKLNPDWLKLLEKYENDFDKEIFFDVDINAQSKHGILQISHIENNNIVKMLKKVK